MEVKNYTAGEHCVISDSAVIGKGTVIGSFVTIYENSVIGENVRIDDGAIIGKSPMKSLMSATTAVHELSPAEIADGAMIGAYAVIYKSAKIGANCLVADLATVREDVTIGEKTVIGRNATIENKTTVGSFTKIQTNAYITAFSSVGSHCFVAPGVVTSNDNYAGRDKERLDKFKGVTLEDGARIGAGATILPGIKILRDGFVAAGAVVTKDVPQKMIVAGNPARILKEVPYGQLLENN